MRNKKLLAYILSVIMLANFLLLTSCRKTTKSESSVAKTPVSVKSDPFSEHGCLNVSGTGLVDSKGKAYQLYGMSTHGIAWFPAYVNYDSFKTLRDDWNTNCIRLAMYTSENGGYCSGGNKDNLKNLIKNGVDSATKLGMYVIIDWHILSDNNPNTNKAEAIAFFKEMSTLYKDKDNVLYEICNEPNGNTSWEDIKSYANEVIPVIRANNKNAVIIVGTPTWCQDIDKVLSSPLEFNNVLYALHFYAATHTDWLRQRLESCISAKLPVFVSEFGMCDASGNGGNDFVQAEQWLKLLDKNNISYMCWNLANKNESSSVISPNCIKTSNWTDKDLSESGKWIRNWFKSK